MSEVIDGLSADVCVIGGGVVGAAIARALAIETTQSVVLLESRNDVGQSTSKANTAILHTGFDAVPGSVESRLVRRGYELLMSYAPSHNIAIERTGALLVAWTEEQLDALPKLAKKAADNGYERAAALSAQDLYGLEPRLGDGALGALSIPDGFIVDPWGPPVSYENDAVLGGAKVIVGQKVNEIEGSAHDWIVHAGSSAIRCRWVVNAAGLGSSAIDAMFGFDRFAVTPRRGQLLVFDKCSRPMLDHILLPVPSAMGKGVLVAPTVFGNVMVGPTAEDMDDVDTSVTRDGIEFLIDNARRILPSLVGESVTAMYAGARAATQHSDYQLFGHPDLGYVCVGGIRSTGLTSSLALAEYCVETLIAGGATPRNGHAFAQRTVLNLGEGPVASSDHELTIAPRSVVISDSPVVCLCERVTAADLDAAFTQPLPAGDFDGLRRRTRAGAGRCAMFHCGADLTASLANSGASRSDGTRISSINARSGRSPAAVCPDVVSEVADVLIVGGGPSGLSCATALAAAGVGRVVVVERAEVAGGIPRHSLHLGFGIRDLHRVQSGPAYAAALVDRAISAGVELWLQSAVLDVSDERIVTVSRPGGRVTVNAKAVVIATGCRESTRANRLIPGDRPHGVMTTSMFQMLAAAGSLSGERVVILGAELVSFSAVMTAKHAGIRTQAMVTDLPRHQAPPGALAAVRAPFIAGATGIEIRSDSSGSVRAVDVTTADGRHLTIPCDLVVTSGDWVAEHEMVRRVGASLNEDALVGGPARAWPAVDQGLRTDVAGVFAIGNVVHGAETADVCALDGRRAATSISAWLTSGQWPTPDVRLAVRPPLRWVAPNVWNSSSEIPARGKVLLRTASFARGRLRLSVGDEAVWASSPRIGPFVPNRSLSVTASAIQRAVDIAARLSVRQTAVTISIG